VALLTLAGSGAARAEEPGASLLDIPLTQLGELRVNTVYAASKFREKIADSPASVTIVTREEIRKFSYRTLADIARSVRGFDVTYDRSYSYTGVRGFNGLGDYGSHVLLLVDGHRMNDPIYDVVAVGTEGLLDVDLIERVEFIRGPSSQMYGSNTFSGAINVVTRDGASVKGGEVSLRAGSFQTWQTRMTLGEKLSNGIDYLLSVSQMASAGPDLYYREFDRPETNHGWVNDQDGDRFWSGLLKISYEDVTFQAGYVSRQKDLPTAAFGTVFNELGTALDARGFAELRYTHETDQRWTLNGRLFFDSYEYDSLSVYNYGGGNVINNDSLTARWWGAEMGASKEFDRFRISFGAEVRQSLDLRMLNYDVRPFVTESQVDTHQLVYGAYVDGRWKLSPSLSLSGGLRWDHYDSFGHQLSPRAGINWQPDEKTTFKLLYGEAFGGPNIAQLQNSTATARANPSLQPETIRSLELTADRNLGGAWKVGASLYHNELADSIQQTALSPMVSTLRNSGKSFANGAEVEIEGKWDNGVEVRLSGARQKLENRSEGPAIRNTPENVWKARLGVPLFDRKVHAALEALYSSSRLTVRDQETPDTWLLNFTLSARDILPGLDASASIYNLLDRANPTPGGPNFRQDMLGQDGLTFGVQLTWHF
jgi:iron complex outermembrane receptor protein